MDALTLHDDPLHQSSTTRIPGEGRAESPIQRWAADRALIYAIGNDLASIQIQLDQLIAARSRREHLMRKFERDNRGRPASHPSIEVGPLERIREWLDRIVARFHEATSITAIYYSNAPIDADRVESRHALELALAERVRTMAGRFNDPTPRRGLSADLQSDLSGIERILGERDERLSPDERRSLMGRVEYGECDGSAKGGGEAEGDMTEAGRHEDLSRAFHRHIDDLRQIEGALLRIDECIGRARGDRPLQEFWRGVARDFREDAHRLAWWIGEEAIRLARTEA